MQSLQPPFSFDQCTFGIGVSLPQRGAQTPVNLHELPHCSCFTIVDFTGPPKLHFFVFSWA